MAFSVEPLLSMGLAYKTKTLCSEFFVSRRPPGDILSDLAIDDLRLLRVLRAEVDTVAGVAIARFFSAERKALFTHEFGCTLSSTRPGSGMRRPEAAPARPEKGDVATAGVPVAESLEVRRALDPVLDEAFLMQAVATKRTRAIVVLHRGHIVAERYAPGIHAQIAVQCTGQAQFAMTRPLAAAPGSAWKYSTGTSLILSQVLRQRLGDRAYHAFPAKALFDPLGLTQAVLELDATGTFVAGSYMYATVREWARFGQLYLQDGVWQDQRILPEGWVAYTRTPAPADPLSSYGAHFWLSTSEEYRGPAAVLPPDMFHAAGHEAQFVTVAPSRDVVIVRLGRTRHPSAWEHDRFVAAGLDALR